MEERSFSIVALYDEHASGGTFHQLCSDVQTGAIFLAVYRSKVSEGIDFSNAKNARAVVAIGFPYPSTKVLHVALKRTYQDEQHAVDTTRVSGAAWYELQAFRALIQALGRCIRHRDDYGAIVFLDSRYRSHAHTKSLSKWARPSVRLFEHASDCFPLLAPFFAANAAARGLGIPTHTVEQKNSRAIVVQYEHEANGRRRRPTGPRLCSIFVPRS